MGYHKLKPIFRENSGMKTLLQDAEFTLMHICLILKTCILMQSCFHQRIIVRFHHHGNEVSLVVNVTWKKIHYLHWHNSVMWILIMWFFCNNCFLHSPYKPTKNGFYFTVYTNISESFLNHSYMNLNKILKND